MRVFHIGGDYPFTPLYRQLLVSLESDRDLCQTMYVPLPIGTQNYRNNDLETAQSSVIYSQDYSKLDRFTLRRKVGKIAASIIRQVDVPTFDIIHTHYLFSNGGAAQLLSARTGIPYISAVRNTDVNLYLRLGLPFQRYGYEIMRDASAVVFLSPAYRDHVLGLVKRWDPGGEVRAKSHVIPNGIHQSWLDNTGAVRDRVDANAVRIIYIGGLTRNKNIERTILALRPLRASGLNASLTIIGKGPQEEHLRKLAAKCGEAVTFIPFTSDRDKLRGYMAEADVFVMASHTETFGLVYIESLSQGLPIVWTRGEGIDGYFPDGDVGYGVNPRSLPEIVDAVAKVAQHRQALSDRAVSAAKDFSWSEVASRYHQLYRRLTGLTPVAVPAGSETLAEVDR
ncbi:MAG: D-inositol-3-phosphate glycosyltransferase [Fimbriimonadaceae bacterium]|nr:D-inositol-3-phosphate glycosyltransferase [Fimbriimonadaceae bacterium]